MAVGRLLQTFFTLRSVLLALIFVLAGQECLAFALSRSAAAKRGTQRQRLPKISAEKVNFRGENACLMAQQHNSDASYTVKSRRELMKESSIVAATALSAPCWVSPAHAISFKEVSPVRSKLSAPNPDRIVNLECLQDLPPLPNDSIRIYLCRHGQTENNRLRRVQGARVDPPINGNGRIQATNLGQALIMAQHPPTLWLASPLTRAQQTAKIGSEQMAKARPSSIATLQSLREVDFGPLSDGEPIQKVQEQIIKAYATWSFGNIDYQPPGGGDSGREVLIRAADALNEIVQAARDNNTNSIAAVSHSTFLRIMLGTLTQETLIQSAAQKIYNGSISVLDVRAGRNDSVQSKGPRQRRPTTVLPIDLDLNVPPCDLTRINEFRHLPPRTLQ